MPDKTETLSFVKDLIMGKFGEFFTYPIHNQTIEKIWQDSNNHVILDNILIDNTISDEAKFLACEIFFKKDIQFMQRHAPAKIAAIYAQALVHNYTGKANSWGLLYEHEDDGPVGIEFLTIGKKAIPALARLLDNDNMSLHYQGSVEASTGNKNNYRIKDFAAYYIGRIMGKPLKYFLDLSERDKQINDLKKEITILFANKD